MSTVLPNLVIPANAGTHGQGRRDVSGYVGPGVRRDGNVNQNAAKVAQQFEALFVGQMLKSARAAALADDPLNGPAAAAFRDFQDEARAQALAKAAPLGVAKLLAGHR